VLLSLERAILYRMSLLQGQRVQQALLRAMLMVSRQPAVRG